MKLLTIKPFTIKYSFTNHIKRYSKYFSLLLAASASLLLSEVTTADETYACLYNGNERTIRVVYANPDSKVPCEVVYEKDTGSQVLWNAQSEEGYCEAQAANLVEKQRGWGWDCAKLEVATEEPVDLPVETDSAPTAQ